MHIVELHRAQMRSFFPKTPTMRYERMLVAGIAAIVAAAIGIAFLGMAIQAATSLTIELLFAEPTRWRQAASLGMLAGGCLSLALSFTLSLLIKVHMPNMERHMPIYVFGQRLALRMLYVACAFGCGFAVLQGLAAAQ